MTGDGNQVDARIVYWGIEGAGVTTNLRTIHAKLRADHRGELRRVPTRLDPSATYPLLPIELGQVGGVPTRLQIMGVPHGPGRVAARKQLLDRVAGLVPVIDCRAECLDETLSSFDELRQSLASYGRSLSDLPVVVQYNKRDLARSFDIESLHRKLDLQSAAVFEAVASEGKGVLQALTTISKRVVRMLSERGKQPSSAPTSSSETVGSIETLPAPTPAAALPPAAAASTRLEDAILLEGEGNLGGDHSVDATLRDTQHVLDRPWDELESEASAGTAPRLDAELRILEVGRAEVTGERTIRVPITLGNPSGERAELALTIALDPLLDPDP
jgi:hypothetical protein